MDKLVNHNLYWLNEEKETPEEKLAREAKEAAAAKKLKDDEEAAAAQKIIDDKAAKDAMMADILKSPEFLAAVNTAAEEKIKHIDPKPKVDPPNGDPKKETELEKQVRELNEKLTAKEAKELAEKKQVIADKFGLEISDLEEFTNINALEAIAPKIAAKAETTVLSTGEYIKKTDTAKIKEVIEALDDGKSEEEAAKLNSAKVLANFKSLF